MTVIMTPGVQPGLSPRVHFGATPKKPGHSGKPERRGKGRGKAGGKDTASRSATNPAQPTQPVAKTTDAPRKKARPLLLGSLALSILLGIGYVVVTQVLPTQGTKDVDGSQAITYKNLLASGELLSGRGKDKEDFRVLAEGRFVDGTAFKVLPQGQICISDHHDHPVQVGTLKPNGEYTLRMQPARSGNVFEDTDVIGRLFLRSDGNVHKAAQLHQALEKAQLDVALSHAWGPKLRQQTPWTGDGVIIAHVDSSAEHRRKIQSVVSDATLGIAPKATLLPFDLSPFKLSRSAIGKQLRQPNGTNQAIADITAAYYDSMTETLLAVQQAKQTQPQLKILMMPAGSSPAEIAQQMSPVFNEQGGETTEFSMADTLMKMAQNPTNYPTLKGSQDRYQQTLKALQDAGILVIISTGNTLPDAASNTALNDPRQFNLAAVNTHAVVVGAYRPLPHNKVQPSTVSAQGMGDTFPQWNPTLLAQGEYVLIEDAGKRQVWAGSSPAVAQVAGLAGLLAQQYPDWSEAQLRQALLKATQPVANQPHSRVGQGTLSVSMLFPAK